MEQRATEAADATLVGHVTSVNVSAVHDFSKAPVPEARLVADLGLEGDAHCGTTVRHRYDRRRDPQRPNLRQVHLISTELIDDLAQRGHVVGPGELGENVTTTGVDLQALPRDTALRLGEGAQVRLTGLRRPCGFIEAFQKGLLGLMWEVEEHGKALPRAGVMGTVLTGGVVRPGDPLAVVLPQQPWAPLGPV